MSRNNTSPEKSIAHTIWRIRRKNGVLYAKIIPMTQPIVCWTWRTKKTIIQCIRPKLSTKTCRWEATTRMIIKGGGYNGRGWFNNNWGGMRRIICFTCYKDDHLSPNCPFKNQIDVNFCTQCGVGNHSLEDLLEHRSVASGSCPILRKNSVESQASQAVQWSKDVVECNNWIYHGV